MRGSAQRWSLLHRHPEAPPSRSVEMNGQKRHLLRKLARELRVRLGDVVEVDVHVLPRRVNGQQLHEGG
jgi:hypothetical protein